MATPLAEIDEALAACLLKPANAAFQRVAALGPDGLRRVHDIYYRGAQWAQPAVPHAGREMVDIWAQILGALAVANPEAYLEEIIARRVGFSTLEVVILGEIEDERASRLLAGCTRHKEWLIRYHAVRGLANRDDPEAIKAVERAARVDCSVSVRIEATHGIARRDKARARTLYLGLLDHPHLTPMLRKEVRSALQK